MNRFYISSIKAIDNNEVRQDIETYVGYIEHLNSVLVAELARANTFSGNQLLRRLGLDVRLSLDQFIPDCNP